MRFNTIPIEMQNLNNWVVAKSGSKVPLQATSYKAASSCDSSTWSTYNDARSAVASGKADYLGFVFDGNGIVGIDIDAGFDEEGFLNELSRDCIEACKSFTEKSRSGRGVHIYVRGKLPFKGKNNGAGVEIYSTGRYFIVTGEKLVYDELAECQEGIDYIVGKYFADSLREGSEKRGNRIYSPQYEKPTEGKISVNPSVYPPIGEGMRNSSLTSLAGQLHTKGYSAQAILAELKKCNREACKPPLPEAELESIVRSVLRYKR